jgi:hypothetical protein
LPGSSKSGSPGEGETEPLTRRELRARDSQETAELPTRRRSPAANPTTPVTDEPAFHQERRLAPVPIALALFGVVVAAAVTAVLIGVAGKSVPPVAATSASPSPIAAAAPAPSATVAAAPRRAAGPNECVDAVGEGGSVDLDAVSMSLERGDLVARFELVAPLPDGAASLGIFAQSRDGERSYQLAATWNDGELDSFFVHNFATGRDTKLSSRDIGWDDTTVTAAFPGDIARSLGSGWSWYAFSTAEGADVDACPGDPLSFQTLTFDDNADSGGNTDTGNGKSGQD